MIARMVTDDMDSLPVDIWPTEEPIEFAEWTGSKFAGGMVPGDHDEQLRRFNLVT